MEQVLVEAKIEVSKPNLGRIRAYNVVMGFLHLVQGLLIIWLSNGFSLPIRTSYLVFNPLTQTLDSSMKHLFDVRFGYWVAAFSFLSALAHFIVSTVYYKKYAEGLSRHINIARWIEYAFSASLMMFLIGVLSGIYDLSTLVLMFGLTAVMNLCGLVMELVNQNKGNKSWSAFWVGSLAGILPWIVIAIYFIGAVTSSDGGRPPSFVYWIYFSIFLFFNSFAINMYLQYKEVGPWKNYLFGEKVYILLSLIAKSALAWQIFAGTLRPQ